MAEKADFWTKLEGYTLTESKNMLDERTERLLRYIHQEIERGTLGETIDKAIRAWLVKEPFGDEKRETQESP